MREVAWEQVVRLQQEDSTTARLEVDDDMNGKTLARRKWKTRTRQLY